MRFKVTAFFSSSCYVSIKVNNSTVKILFVEPGIYFSGLFFAKQSISISICNPTKIKITILILLLT